MPGKKKGSGTPQDSPTLGAREGETTASSPTIRNRKPAEKVKAPAADNGKSSVKQFPPVPKETHFFKDLLVKLIVFGVAVVFVQVAPAPSVDVQKASNTSFLNLYFQGKLDKIPFITQMLLAATVSVFFDTGVIYYHLSNPPHPKFVMLTSRKLSIYTHLISGIVEIVTGVIAFTVPTDSIQNTAATIMSLASITHALTAYYQTAMVFGAKGIMTPGYLYAITLHITNAFRLFHNPSSVISLLTTFLMLHIYVWCRVFVYIFRAFNAFNGYHYTCSIMLSGALLFPYALGPIGNYAFLFIAFVYCLLEAFLSGKSGRDLARKLFVEHERYALLSHDSLNEWKETVTKNAGLDNDERMAREVFDAHDTNKSGKLGINELSKLINAMPVPDHVVAKVMANADVSGDGSLSFDEFYRFVWDYGTVKQRLGKKPKAEQPVSPREQARLVFDMLDVDRSGFIEVAELEMLLTQWGMPEGEADSYLQGYGHEQKIHFDIFYKDMKPIWSFAIVEVFEA
jgi:Ca2+-binding EF-hand superfamily protein/uncharacterized membrane protein